jgi:3-hydroxy-3-methylglutaryl CoA synthase
VRMEGRETYRYATKTMATTALKAIERAGWQPDEIDLFIPHQANVRIIESVAKGLNLPMDKMFVNVDRYGNTSAASVPIALAEAVDSGRIRIGDKVVLVAFGAGLTSGGIALEWTADPVLGRRAESVEPVAKVREPMDWSSVDPIPDRLRQVLESAGPPVPLDDVVPGEPEHAHKDEVLA